MKLPEELANLDLWTPQLFEAIVRDCANIAMQTAAIKPFHSTAEKAAPIQMQSLSRIAIRDAILARYGLEP